MANTNRTHLCLIVTVTLPILLVSTACSLLHSQAPGLQESISITSPSAGSELFAGSSVTVVITPSPGVVLSEAWAELSPITLEIPPIDTIAPYEIELPIPVNFAGTTKLIAGAKTVSGTILEDQIVISIFHPAQLDTIEVDPPAITISAEELSLPREARGVILHVRGLFANATRLDISGAVRFVSTNPNVAVLDGVGHVVPLASGRSTIEVSYGPVSTSVPVKVGISELFGDLDGDLDVDADDLDIIRSALGSASTGPGDPRDLLPDGVIDNRDLERLQEECSRPECGTGKTTSFRRGDSNADTGVDIADPIHTLFGLFIGSPVLPCLDASDSNDDGDLNVTDPVYTLNYLFRGGPALLFPGPFECANDPTPDSLGCDSFAPCNA